MPSQQQESAKKGSEKYLMFEPNQYFDNFEVGWRTFPGHENVFR